MELWLCVLLLSIGLRDVDGALGTSVINCEKGSEVNLGSVDEGYTGEIELVTGIVAGSSVSLVSYLFPEHLAFLELRFVVGQTTATIHTKKALDADVVDVGILYYDVVCDDANQLPNNRRLQINDKNDNTPAFTKELYNETISEILSVNTPVLRVQAIDNDISNNNSRLSYSMLPGSEDFRLTESGSLIVTRRLNYNSQQQYTFIVKAQDVGGLSDEARVHINIEDIDNLNPYFNHNLYQASIPENQMGPFQRIMPEAIEALDGDTGINAPMVYGITQVSPPTFTEHFHIDSSSGVVSLSIAIDRERLGSPLITVSIKASQADDPSKTAESVVIVTVEDVNDNAPVFSQQTISVTIEENSPVDVVVFMAAVLDADQGGFLGNLSIVPESAPFAVSSDGSVRVKDSTALDREAHESFLFQVKAVESDPPNQFAMMNVNVTLLDQNDNSPEFTQGVYVVNVPRDQKEGMPLVQVTAEDSDEGQNGKITYSLDFGNKDGYFSINNQSGEITLKKPIPLLEDKILEMSLFITATDGGKVSRSSFAQVNVFAPGDFKPQFTQKTYKATIEEEQEAGVVILKVTFLTLGSEAPPILQVVTETDKFAISSDGSLTTARTLDFDEAPHNYSVGISISDGVNTDHAVVQVEVTDINDNNPEFDASSIITYVLENIDVGDNVTAVLATDKDDGFNGDIRYSLVGGDGKFAIDPESGMVWIAAQLDRESEPEFSLLIVAQDQGRPAKSGSVTLKVLVGDCNDNIPEFSKIEFSVDVAENVSVSTLLLILSAADPDEGLNGKVTYSILTQSPPSTPAAFELDPSTGELRLAQTLDFSVARMYRVTIEAVDGGTPALVGNSTVVIRVVDVNNNPPKFNRDRYDVSVLENLPSGATVVNLDVTDKDEDGFSNGHFILTSDTFDINKSGMLFLRNNVTLDRETQNSYQLQVIAVDTPTDGLSANAELNITVLDYNDNSPEFGAFPDPVHFSEGDYSPANPGEVHTFQVTDDDEGPNGKVTLSFPSPNPLFTLREDNTLVVVGPLDRESRDSFEIVILASDNGTPRRENFTTIRLSVADVNDNVPKFSAERYSQSILVKEAKEGDLVMRLLATDKDAGNNSLITYSFSAGAPFVSVHSESGEVTLASDLADVTKDTTVTLTAMATDHGHRPLNSTVPVVINLRMGSLVDEVSFDSSSYNFTVHENRPEGSTVGAVTAYPGDNIYTINYTLVTHMDLFSIDGHGAIVTNKALDKESRDLYILEVKAVDSRVPPTTATAVVSVQVVDVNEEPRFVSESFTVQIFSIAFYKSPVVYVQATDPDLGDQGQLVYGLAGASPYFDVDSSSGLLYVVSVEALAGQTSEVEVQATDPGGLNATTTVKVKVQVSVISNVVVIALNQAANVVDSKIPEIQRALERAIGWTVEVIGVSNTNGGTSISRTSQPEPKAYVSFIAMDGVEVVSSEDVKRKLQSKSEVVKAELEMVFGKGLQFAVEEEAYVSTSNGTVIAMGVLLGMSILALILMVVLSVVKFRRMKKRLEEPDREKFEIDRQSVGFTNTARETSESFTLDPAPLGGSSLGRESRSRQDGQPEPGLRKGQSSTEGDDGKSMRSESEAAGAGSDTEGSVKDDESRAKERKEGVARTGNAEPERNRVRGSADRGVDDDTSSATGAGTGWATELDSDSVSNSAL